MDGSFHNLNLSLGLVEFEKHTQFKFHKLKLKQLEVELTIMKGAMARTFIFLGILVGHWVAQFLAWSYAERNNPMRVLWNILATPLVHAAGSSANHYFWAVASLNSLLWAAVLTYVVARYALKH